MIRQISQKNGGNASSAPAVSGAIQILNVLRDTAPLQLGVSDLSRLSNVGKATCFRILQTLVEGKYVMQNPVTKEYSLGPELIRLGDAATGDEASLSAARAILPALASETGMSAAVFKLVDRSRLMVVARATSPSAFHVNQPLGSSFPLVPPMGTIQIAWVSKEDFRLLNESTEASGFGNYGEINKVLVEDVEWVRRHGYSWSVHFGGVESRPNLQAVETWLDEAARLGIGRRSPSARKLQINQIRRFAKERDKIADRDLPPAPIFGIAAPIFNVEGWLALHLATTCFLSQVDPSSVETTGKIVLDKANHVTAVIGGRKPASEQLVDFGL